ncbi:MAG TPA: hypothetical protein PKC30_07625 [Saprospiraceae bacterium]|nr:hypothetical protein [Saprospiraceae bacterium]
MKLLSTAIFSLFLLMIVNSGNAQFCNCPTDTIFTNLNGIIFDPFVRPDLPSPDKELLQACDEGTINLLNLVCTLVTLPDENESENQIGNSPARITDEKIDFSGDGVEGYCFDPVIAGVGIHNICLCIDHSTIYHNQRNIHSRGTSDCSMGSNYDCCQFQIAVIDANLDFGVNDPCSCDDPLNVQNPGEPVTLFHDLLTFEGIASGYTVVIFGFDGFGDPVYLTENPMGIDLQDELDIVITENINGLYQLDIWRLPSSTFTIDWRVIRNSDDEVVFETDDEDPFEMCLGAEDCPISTPIPTMGTWALFILSLLLAIGGAIAIRIKAFKPFGGHTL